MLFRSHTRAARQVQRHHLHLGGRAEGAGTAPARGAEQRHDGVPEGRGDVKRERIHAQQGRRALDQCAQLLQRQCARQIHGLGDEPLRALLEKVWGKVTATSAERRAQIESLKSKLTPERLKAADATKGRALFKQTCAACHTLFGEGGAIGPDLTGSGRRNLDYLLENIIDPSAVVAADYRASTVELKDGRSLTGVISGRAAKTLNLQTMTEKLTLRLDDIQSTRDSALSLMPDGLLSPLSDEQIRDLIAYLSGEGR